MAEFTRKKVGYLNGKSVFHRQITQNQPVLSFLRPFFHCHRGKRLREILFSGTCTVWLLWSESVNEIQTGWIWVYIKSLPFWRALS